MITLNAAPTGIAAPSWLKIPHLPPVYNTPMGWLLFVPPMPPGFQFGVTRIIAFGLPFVRG